jgi:hypothetical protein
MTQSDEATISNIRGLWTTYGKKSSVFNDVQRYNSGKLAFCARTLLNEKFTGLLWRAKSLGVPVLVAHMSDGWATNMQRHKSCNTPGSPAFQRIGKFRAEWLAERYIAKYLDSGGKIQIAMQLKPPRLMQGKTGWHVINATLEDPFIRNTLPNNILIHFYIQDGLHSKGMYHKQRARHELYYDLHDDGSDNDDLYLQRCSDWVFGMRCILHIGSSAVKWGLAPLITETLMEFFRCNTYIRERVCENQGMLQ